MYFREYLLYLQRSYFPVLRPRFQHLQITFELFKSPLHRSILGIHSVLLLLVLAEIVLVLRARFFMSFSAIVEQMVDVLLPVIFTLEVGLVLGVELVDGVVRQV
jgi:uncharacterized membrane protein (UPF0182 family)